MSDVPEGPIEDQDSDYEPNKDPEVQKFLETVLSKWKKDNTGMMERATTLTKYIIVARADGWDESGNAVTQIMIVPGGTDEDMLGLLANADTRFRAEIVAAIIERNRS